jgi:hypothetical protein
VTTTFELCCEVYRLELMRGLEVRLQQSGFARVAGVDEAGRGCLAGPVVAAAVIPDPDRPIPGADDSKRLRPAARTELAAMIRRTALACAVVAVPAEVIDQINILQATRLAMRQAIGLLALRPDAVVVDAVTLEDVARDRNERRRPRLPRGREGGRVELRRRLCLHPRQDGARPDAGRVRPRLPGATVSPGTKATVRPTISQRWRSTVRVRCIA